MAQVTFHGGPMDAPVTCEYQADGQTTLLALARRHGIPIYWHCGQGTCATCAVEVTALRGDQPDLSRRERAVLDREGLLSAAAAPQWRLSCRYPLGGEDLYCRWPDSP